MPYYPTTWEVAIPKTDDNEVRVLIARGWAERGGATVEQRDNGNLIVLTLSMEIDGKAKVGRYDAELRRMTSELFEGAGAAHRSSVLPEGVPVVSVEAGVTTGWQRWADASVGIDRFGASAPGATVMAELGITPEAVAAAAREVMS